MAAVNRKALEAQASAAGLGALPWAAVQVLVGRIVWQWALEHWDDTVTKIRVKVLVLPLRVTVKVRDCDWLLRALFGPPPAVPV